MLGELLAACVAQMIVVPIKEHAVHEGRTQFLIAQHLGWKKHVNSIRSGSYSVEKLI